jgi:hypothetical protein
LGDSLFSAELLAALFCFRVFVAPVHTMKPLFSFPACFPLATLFFFFAGTAAGSGATCLLLVPDALHKGASPLLLLALWRVLYWSVSWVQDCRCRP